MSETQLTYAPIDASVLIPLHHILQIALAKGHLLEVAELEMASLPAIAWLELAGAPFDADAWANLSDEAMARKLALEDEVQEMFAEALAANGGAGGRINPNSPAQVKKALAALGVRVDSTREDVLTAVEDAHPVITRLLDYREASKKAGTYGIEFLKHVHPITRRIHADYRQIGAATGRMACSRPNQQQIPNDPRYRGCYRPPVRRVLVKADLSLIELCNVAELSGDERMIQAITEQQDLHRLTAAALLAKAAENVTADERSFGKGVNFATLYGQGRNGLIQLASRHGLSLTEDEAAEFQRRFAKAWPQLAAWKKRRMRGTKRSVRTASGRKRRLARDISGTVRVNTPVQGTAADGFKAALAKLWQTRHQYPSAVPVLAVHDELVVECDADDAHAVAHWVETCLQEGMAQYLTRVPVRVETQIAPSWAGNTNSGE